MFYIICKNFAILAIFTFKFQHSRIVFYRWLHTKRHHNYLIEINKPSHSVIRIHLYPLLGARHDKIHKIQRGERTRSKCRCFSPTILVSFYTTFSQNILLHSLIIYNQSRVSLFHTSMKMNRNPICSSHGISCPFIQALATSNLHYLFYTFTNKIGSIGRFYKEFNLL